MSQKEEKEKDLKGWQIKSTLKPRSALIVPGRIAPGQAGAFTNKKRDRGKGIDKRRRS